MAPESLHPWPHTYDLAPMPSSQAPPKWPRYNAPVRSIYATPQPTAPALQLQEVEGKLADLHRITCALRTQRNALLPIARLPPEVLSHTFHLLAQLDSEQPYPRTRPYPPALGSPGSLGWIRISHVCRRWRAIALHDTALWADSVCALPAATDELLRRARTAPIAVRHDFGLHRHKGRVLRTVLRALAPAQLARTREIRISANKRTIARLADALQGETAPMLESLHLSLSVDARIGFFYEMARLPPRLLASTPRLRRLVLENCRMPWDSLILRGLTHLEVRLVAFSVPDPLLATTAQLLAVLERCPALETLVLIDSIPDIPDGTPLAPAARRVHLPALERLALAGRPLNCANVVQHLCFPPTAALELTCTGLGQLDELRSAVGPLLRPHAGRKLRRLSITANMSDVSVHGDAGPGGRSLRAAVEMNCLRASFHPIACVRLICENLDLHDVGVLALDVSEGQMLPPKEWRSVLDGMPLVRQLRLCGPGAYEVLQGLQVPKDESGKMGLPLESLHALQLSGMCLNFAPSDSEEDLFAVLLRCLEVRKACGLGVTEVGVERCTGDLEQMQRLKRAAKSVFWDGDEEGMSVTDDEDGTTEVETDSETEEEERGCEEECGDDGFQELGMFWT